MQIVIKIPKEFEEHFNKDKFSDSLARVASDIENFGVPLSGRYEQEIITMLRKAFEDATPLEAQPTDEIKEAYLKGYDYGVKDWFKSKIQPCENAVILNVTSEGCWREEEEYSYGLKSKRIWWDGSVAESEDEE